LLKDEKIDYIYSSDLARTADTAKEIAKYHPNTPLIFTEELREYNAGIMQGKTNEELEPLKLPSYKHNIHLKPEGGESFMDMYNRAEKFIKRIFEKRRKEETILVAGHNAVNLALFAAITGKKPEEMSSLPFTRNTAITIFEIDEDRSHKIHVLNCTKHLE
jgi:broad specificity phosphatase PhoE